MERGPRAWQYAVSSIFLMLTGWGGLALLILVFSTPPLVWARWGFFSLWFIALCGTALPIMYFFNVRFPSDPPIEPNGIVRQALWVGLYGSVLAWLQLGRAMAFWMWFGLAAGLIGIEYLIRLREQSRWRPPLDLGAGLPPPGGPPAESDVAWTEGDESSR
jgi:hypothetical protein